MTKKLKDVFQMYIWKLRGRRKYRQLLENLIPLSANYARKVLLFMIHFCNCAISTFHCKVEYQRRLELCLSRLNNNSTLMLYTWLFQKRMSLHISS